MAKYRIEQDRESCIGCGACASICPENWEMSDDSKSRPKKTDIEEKDLEKNKEAAEACPVNVIHITDTETNEKLI